MSYQSLIIVGYLGRDPELRYTPAGQPVCNFSVATSRKYTNNGQPVDETTWFHVTTFGKQAENANQYLKKGSMVLVAGQLKPGEGGNPRVWTRQDGSAAASFEVVANTVNYLSSSGKTEVKAPDEEENIPF